MRKPGLGRGLDALLGVGEGGAGREELRHMPLDLLQPGKYQPRSHMDPTSLEALAASIRAQGIMQPVVVRPVGMGRYEIIAGERRWRAAQLAGLAEVPTLVRDVPDEQALVLALIENLQRENLNPIEQAQALNRLLSEFKLTHEALAEQIGGSRSGITNIIRLLRLPGPVRASLEEGRLSVGHARALLGLGEAQQLAVAKTVVARDLSVRDTERLVRRLQDGDKRERSRDPDIRRLEERLSDMIGARVHIAQRGRKGRLSIEYHSLEQLDGVLSRLGWKEE